MIDTADLSRPATSGGRPLRILLLGQGGDETLPGIRGHLRVETLLQEGLSMLPGVRVEVARAGPWTLGERIAGGRWPGLHRLDLDGHDLRWHLVEATRARRRLSAAVERHRPDAIHVHSHVLALRLGALPARAPVVLSVDAGITDWRALDPGRRRWPWSEAALAPALALERRALRRAALIVAWTEWARAGVRRAAPGVDPYVLHPGVDTDRFRPAPGRRRGGPLRVLFVGGRFADKGGPELVAAAADIGAELDLVTPVDVPPRPGVRVHRLSAGEPRLLELIADADVFCLPTHRDAAPLAILEAMASGLPVVASDIAGIPELLAGGRCGLLLPAGDGRALRSALAALRDDPARRRALGEAGRSRAVANYDARRQAARLMGLVREHVRSASTTP